MPGRQFAVIEPTVHRSRQRQQPQRVSDMAAALADGFGKTRLGAAKLLHQPAIGLGLLERRQILALQVLDQRDFQRLGIRQRADDDRNFVHPDALRGAPPPLAGNQLEGGFLTSQRADQQGLDDALFADRLGERVEFRLAKAPPWLEGARADQLDRYAALRWRIRGRATLSLAKQGCEATAELAPSRPLAHCGAPALRRNNSAASRI